MISTLTGNVTELFDNQAIIEVNNIGYGVWVSLDDLSRLSINKSTKIYIYEHIREQAYDLYGFCTATTKHLFEQLLSVNGVGPRMALAILSVGPINDVRDAIANGQTKFLQMASGVGKKVAERIVVDLKDKVGIDSGVNAIDFLTSPSINSSDEAQAALISLGYTPQDAANALKGVNKLLSTEERIKLALRSDQ